MTRFRSTSSVKYVTPHTKGKTSFVRSARTLGTPTETGKAQSGKPRTKRKPARQHLVKKTLRQSSLAHSAANEDTSEHTARGMVATGSALARSRATRGILTSWMGRKNRHPERHRFRATRSGNNSALPGSNHPAQTSSVLSSQKALPGINLGSSSGPALPTHTSLRAGSQLANVRKTSAPGIRPIAPTPRVVQRRRTRQVAGRAQQVAATTSRAIMAAASHATAAVASAIAAVGSGAMMLVVTLVAVVMIVLSILPAWLTNIIIDDEVAPVSMVAGDDYPWADDVRGPDGTPTAVYNTVNTSTNYYFGNCTDFVFWRVNRDVGATVDNWTYKHADLTPRGGHGKQWGADGNLPGWQTITDHSQARTGDIISFQQGVFGHDHWAGHVAYIAYADPDGSVTTENYGSAQYYVETIPADVMKEQIRSGGIVIKRNPDVGTVLPSVTDSNIVDVASKYIGMPYGRGAGNGSFDCCTLARHVYREALGIILPMSVPGNPAARSKCEYAMYSLAASYGGHYVPATLASLKPGDILFFQASYISPAVDNITHVAIYAGNGQVIDAIPSGGVGIRNLSFYTIDKLLPQAVRIG